MGNEPDGTALEGLWSGEFGDAYVKRNAAASKGRQSFWVERLAQIEPKSVLEVGCNLGGNLQWIVDAVEGRVAGIDVNETALVRARENVPGAELQQASAYELPFGDGEFDLVFTTGVLIHIPPRDLDKAIDEIVRCSGRYILCGEYFAEQEEEVPYRGQTGALFRRDYGGIYQQRHPELKLVDKGFLSAGDDSSWDDVTWWLLERL